MIRLVLILLLLFLFHYNIEICTYYFPDFQESSTKWKEWYYLRCRIYEVMFLIGFAIPLFKGNQISTSISLGCVVILIGSVTDKFTGIYSSHWHDTIVYILALAVVITHFFRLQLKDFFTIKK